MSKFKVGDKVRILDGSKIKDYAGGWNPSIMAPHVGDVTTIEEIVEKDDTTLYFLGLHFPCCYICWDERGLEPVNEDQKIVITTDGKKTTTAVLYNGKQRIKEVSATCCSTDKFDFKYGASLALDKLTGFVRGSVECTLDVKPKELLKNGMFGHHNEYGWFVVVGDKFIYEDGGYSFIDKYNDDLVYDDDSYVDILIEACAFNNAKEMHKGNIVWRRND